MWLQKMTLLVSCISSSICLSNLLTNIKSDSYFDNACIKQVVDLYLNSPNIVLYLGDEFKSGLDWIHSNKSSKSYKGNKSEEMVNFYKELDITPNDYIFLISKTKDVMAIREILKIIPTTRQFIVVISKLRENRQDLEFLKLVIDEFAKYAILNVLVALVYSEEKIDYYTWNSHDPKRRCGTSTEIKLRASCSNGNFSNGLQFIYQKPPLKDFDNCELHIEWLEQDTYVINPTFKKNPGILVSLFNTIGEITSINVIYDRRSEVVAREFYYEGTLFEFINALGNNSKDAAIGNLFLNDTELAPFDFGPVFYQDYFYICGRKPGKLTTYRNLLPVFKNDTWLVVFLILVFSSLIIYFSLKANEAINQYYPFNRVFLETFGIYIGIGSGFNTSLSFLRVFYASLLLYGLNIDAIYLGKLSSIFSHPSREAEMKSAFQIRKQEGKLNINWFIEELSMSTSYLKGHPKLMETLIIRNGTPFELLHLIASHQENISAAFRSVLEAHKYENSKVDCYMEPYINISMFGTFYLRKYNSINNAVQYWAQELTEMGFVRKWWNDIISCRLPAEAEEDQTAEQLKIAHYFEAFIMLFGGFGLAIIAFICELCVNLVDLQLNEIPSNILEFDSF